MRGRPVRTGRFLVIALLGAGSMLLAHCRATSPRETATALAPAVCYRAHTLGELGFMRPGSYDAPYPGLFGLSQETLPPEVAGVRESELHYVTSPVPRGAAEPGFGFWYRLRDSVAIHWQRNEATFVMVFAQRGDTLAGRGSTYRTNLGVTVNGPATYVRVECPDSMITDRHRVERMLKGPASRPLIEARCCNTSQELAAKARVYAPGG